MNDSWVSTPDNTERFRFDTSSHTYIRTGADFYIRNASNADMVTVTSAGNLTATGDVTAFSDARLKENVRTIDQALDKLESLRGVYFTKDGKESTGVIAQEVMQIMPEAVNDEGEYLSVAYGNLVGLVIEAVKELRSEVKDLKHAITN